MAERDDRFNSLPHIGALADRDQAEVVATEVLRALERCWDALGAHDEELVVQARALLVAREAVEDGERSWYEIAQERAAKQILTDFVLAAHPPSGSASHQIGTFRSLDREVRGRD